jgi:hypothetical protein
MAEMSARQRLVALVTAIAASLAMACTESPFAPAGSRNAPTLGGGTGTATGLVGEWTRELLFLDEFGFAHSSKTTWTFSEVGTATRTVVTANFTLGQADTTVTSAEWRIVGTTVEIEFIAPSPGTITLDFRIEDNTLFLAGQAYERTS